MTYRLWFSPKFRWSNYDFSFATKASAESYITSTGFPNYEAREWPESTSLDSVDNGSHGPNTEANVQLDGDNPDGGKEQSDAGDDAQVGAESTHPDTDSGMVAKRVPHAEQASGTLGKGVDGNTSDPLYYRALVPEPIECIEGWDLGPHLANVVKYVSRYGRKHSPGDTGDLRKALAYLTRYISLAETGRGSWELPGNSKDS